MKNLFVATLLVCGMGVFANNSKNETVLKNSGDVMATVCCDRSASNEYGDQVTVHYCVISTGDFAFDKGRACAGAASTAKQVAKLMIAMH